jgi:hypothetical protein
VSNRDVGVGSILCFICLIVGQLSLQIVHAQDNNEQYKSQLTICTVDSPLTYVREAVTLEVWVPFSKQKELKYNWQVDAGAIKGEGAQVSWDFTNVSPGMYKAKVQVWGRDQRFDECSLIVTVGLPPLALMSGGYETGRTVLLRDKAENKGYGLYSYLLFGAEPDTTTRSRYLQAIIEFLKFPDVKSLEKSGFKPSQLNITYLLLEENLTEGAVQDIEARRYDKYPQIADWILNHYDYARARSLLHNLPGEHRDGPYVISFLQPLGQYPLTPPYLYMNISRVPPHIVKIWMKYFLGQAAQVRYWDENTAKRLVLELRTLVGVAAEGLPEVQNALNVNISWVKKLS